MRINWFSCMIMLCFTIIFCGNLPGNAQSAPVKDLRYYFQAAQQAYAEGQYDAYRESLQEMLRLRPNHPTYLYNLAGANALSGRSDEALAILQRVAAAGLIYPAAEDEDFAAIRSSEMFAAILAQFESNRRPVSRSETAVIVKEKGLISESVAYDPQNGRYWISSVHRRKIVTVDREGNCRDFTSPQDDVWGVFGIKLDARRQVLWACSGVVPEIAGYSKAEADLTGIFKYDRGSGKLLKRYLLPPDGSAHLFGDLVLNAAGDVFISDSFSPRLYVIRAENDTLTELLQEPAWVSPQGITAGAEDSVLYVADYRMGLYRIDLARREARALPYPENAILMGIDGLYYHDHSLIAVQNGVNPQRIIRARLNPTGDRIEQVEVLEANNEQFDEPTLGVVVDNSFYYIANSQWGSTLDKAGQLRPESELKFPLVLKMGL